MSKTYVYVGPSRFIKFFMVDLFTGELISVPESVFDSLVVNFRNLYEMHYDGPNAQNFYFDGVLQARRER